MAYCVQDKDGHCQDIHITEFSSGGGSYDGDSGGGGGGGSSAGPIVFVLVIFGLIAWGLISVSNYMSGQIEREAAAYVAPAVYRGNTASEPTSRFNGHYVDREEVGQSQLESEKKKVQSSPVVSRWVNSIPGIALGEDSGSVSFHLELNRKLGSGNIDLPSAHEWSKCFHFLQEDVEFDCVIVCGGCDIIYVDKYDHAHMVENASSRFSSFRGRSFKVRPYESSAYMYVSMKRR